ncbi:TetR/AcrR family transcriptional regulator [Paenibacillus sp. GCM10023248]|uniref:TetR/AcrR family transcriptional regulator n=1 Tax=Bacillales TaxID=1385 RepID=UPI002377F5E5|nr:MULTISPECIES: TetR/AcrR family transcriptional regulator [Bacillales]MDD9267039.1 TetR/AcrR family transcriptional regulator [Paenibacillus sp. MAHUQ-63]MDR6881240.1 TetR/AcrR family transcriptional repressor of nem operon [Bacillus sp. 3255]
MARSKEFEINTVLRKAMDVFWEKGYEKTSMQDLVNGMGIHRRSIYDTFGDKHELFMRIMDKYDELMDTAILRRDADDRLSPKQAIRHMFEHTISKSEFPSKGCLMVNTAVELAIHDEEAAEKVNQSFSSTEARLLELIQRGRKSGEITSRHEDAQLAQFLNNGLLGLRVLVKTTGDRAKLQAIVDTTLSLLD